MLRKVLGTVLLLGALSGCTQPLRVCETDSDCSEGGACDQATHLCYRVVCDTPCAPYEACVATNTCGPLYTDLVVTPGDGTVLKAGEVTVRAELRVRDGFTPNYPETLSFSVTRSDGGAGGALVQVERNEGVYTAKWTPPGDGVFRLKVVYPEAGGPSTTVNLSVDATPPTFLVTVPPADAGVSDGGTTYADPEPGFATAWRRDQVAPVEIRTNEPNLDPSTLSVVLQGTDGGTVPGGSVTAFAQSEPCDAGYCGVAQVQLWEPPFDTFRGTMTVAVSGADKVGNTGSGSTTVNVTRWKWVFNAQGGIKSTPAIGQLGTIYFGTEAGSVGKVFALNPDGTKKWDKVTGAVLGSPAVGAWNGSSELVYVADTSTASVSLYALDGAGGDVRQQCPYSTGSPVVVGATAVLDTTVSSSPVETGLFVVNNYGSAIGIRPDAVGSQALECVRLDNSRTMPSMTANGSLAVENGGVFYYPTETKRIVKYAFDSGATLRWSVDPSAQRLFGVALVGDQAIGAGGIDYDQGGVFSVPREAVSAPSLVSALPETPSGRIYQFVSGNNGLLYFGQETASNQGRLVRYDLTGTRIDTFVSNAGVFQSAPVLGTGDILYTVSTTGEVGAWLTSGLSTQWKLAGLGAAGASLTHDCRRDDAGSPQAGYPGVLYVPAGGKLHAFVVDSRGLDTSAPWPKYQHDSRNTGNPDTPISSCP